MVGFYLLSWIVFFYVTEPHSAAHKGTIRSMDEENYKYRQEMRRMKMEKEQKENEEAEEETFVVSGFSSRRGKF